MAVSSFFLKGLKKILEDEINLSSDTLKAALVDADYVFDKESEFFDTGASNVNNPKENQVVATSYVPVTLPSDPLITVSVTSHGSVIIALPDVSFGIIGGATNGTAAGVVLYKQGASDLTSPVIAFIPLDEEEVTSGNLFNVDFNTNAEGGNLVIGLPDQSGGS